MGYLLGVLGNYQTNVSLYLKELKEAVSTDIDKGQSSRKQSDGWGVGFYQHGNAYLIKKSSPIEEDERIESLTQKIKPEIFISHVRQAAVGEVKVTNSQPFRYGSWLFAHQGTIQQFRRIKPKLRKAMYPPLMRKLQGVTDSEHCFFLFLSLLKGTGYLKGKEISIDLSVRAIREMFSMLDDWAVKSKVTESSDCNIIVTNGLYLIAARRGSPLFVRTISQTSKPTTQEFSLLPNNEEKKAFIISSTRFGEQSLWANVPTETLYIINTELESQTVPITM